MIEIELPVPTKRAGIAVVANYYVLVVNSKLVVVRVVLLFVHTVAVQQYKAYRCAKLLFSSSAQLLAKPRRQQHGMA